jgi:hypothetical protein
VGDELDLLRDLGREGTAPDEESVSRARALLQRRIDRARGGPPRPWRPFHLRWGLTVAIALLLGSGFGFALGTSDTSSSTAANAPVGLGFLPERGWSVLQTAKRATLAQEAIAIAANVPISPDDAADRLPYATMLNLRRNGVVMLASFTARGDKWRDQHYPVRALPLRLRDAAPGIIQVRPKSPLGQYRLQAGVNCLLRDAPPHRRPRNRGSASARPPGRPAGARSERDRRASVPNATRTGLTGGSARRDDLAGRRSHSRLHARRSPRRRPRARRACDATAGGSITQLPRTGVPRRQLGARHRDFRQRSLQPSVRARPPVLGPPQDAARRCLCEHAQLLCHAQFRSAVAPRASGTSPRVSAGRGVRDSRARPRSRARGAANGRRLAARGGRLRGRASNGRRSGACRQKRENAEAARFHAASPER